MYAFERIHIELTNKCNFSCSFCPDSVMTRYRGDMDFKVLIKILDEIFDKKLTSTIFFHVMGEPLLYEKIDKAILAAKERKLKVVLTTNAALLTSDMTKKLLKTNIDRLILSVQTPCEESFKLRNANINFDEYKDTIINSVIQFMKNSNTKIILSFLVTPFKRIFLPNNKMNIINNKKELEEKVSFWIQEIEAKEQDKFNYNKNKIIKNNILKQNTIKLIKNLFVETRMLGDWVQPALFSNKVKRAYFGCCEGLSKHFGILWNGDIVFCCVDFDAKTKFGNVCDIDITDALQQEKVSGILKSFKKFRIIHPYCQRCLGDISFFRSIIRQLGSIVYFKFFKKKGDL